ncbi:hypothetical protein BT93_E2505 [Corymbia citriodora subsp. variegata]|nr:hypothetical protein BT93_E2505 [Corymbia citriodora subsp. variegata]
MGVSANQQSSSLPHSTAIQNSRTPMSGHTQAGKDALAPRSWANVARTAMRGYELDYIEPMIIGDELVANFEEEDLDTTDPMWFECLVGYLIGKKLPFQMVEAALKHAWGSKLVEVRADDQAFFFLRVPDAVYRRRLLESGPITVARVPLILQQWDPMLELKKDNHVKVPVWIRLRNIPLALWTKRGISGIASLIGHPLYVDQNTEQKKFLAYARVCVELRATDSRRDTVKVCLKGATRMVSIEYEWRPISCVRCGTFGHRCSPPDQMQPVVAVAPRTATPAATEGLRTAAPATAKGLRTAAPAAVAAHRLALQSSVSAAPRTSEPSAAAEASRLAGKLSVVKDFRLPEQPATAEESRTAGKPSATDDPRLPKQPAAAVSTQAQTTARVPQTQSSDQPGKASEIYVDLAIPSESPGQWQVQPPSKLSLRRKMRASTHKKKAVSSLPASPSVVSRRRHKDPLRFDEAIRRLAGLQQSFSSADDLEDSEAGSTSKEVGQEAVPKASLEGTQEVVLSSSNKVPDPSLEMAEPQPTLQDPQLSAKGKVSPPSKQKSLPQRPTVGKRRSGKRK